MRYAIEVVGDDELPGGVNAVIVEREGHAALMLLNGQPARVWEMMRAWEDTMEPSCEPSITLPLRVATRTPVPTGWQALARTAI